MSVNGFYQAGKNQKKSEPVSLCLAGAEQIDSVVRDERPVVVLAGAVYPVKGLFVQYAGEIVSVSNFFENFHYKLVMVCGNICRKKDGADLVLAGRDFSVLNLRWNAVAPQFQIDGFHKGADAFVYSAGIMRRRVLILCGHCAKKRPPRIDEVFSF